MEYVLLWMAFGVVASIIAKVKGRGTGNWFCMGILFGPFALVIALLPKVANGKYKKCPYCAEIIFREAIKCRHCGSNLAAEIPGAVNLAHGAAGNDIDPTHWAYKAGKLFKKLGG